MLEEEINAWRRDRWSCVDIQDVVSLYRFIKFKGFEFDEVLENYVKHKKHTIQKAERAQQKFCPECGAPMRLFQVNTPNKATEVGGGYKTQWQCSVCAYDIFSKNTIEKEVLSVLKEV